MKIQFTQIYAEENAEDYIPFQILISLRERLNSLEKTMPHYIGLFKTNDYMVLIYILARREKEEVSIPRPNVLSKSKMVEFYVHVPFKKEENYVLFMNTYLSHIEKGITLIFRKYKVELDGVAESFSYIKELIQNKPQVYKQKYDKFVDRSRKSNEAYHRKIRKEK